MSIWTMEQIEQWRLLYRAYTKDAESIKRHKDVDQRRQEVQKELLCLLRSFLDSTVTLVAFNTAFQLKIRNEWNVFHLRGMSGGLFFNKLVKYVPSEATFAHLLRLMIHVPEGRREAQQRLQAFVQFIEGLITSQQVQRAQLQPARIPFFLSIWWHIQDQERWPIFYGDVRGALMGKGQTTRLSSDPVEDYVSFRSRFLALGEELGISSWELEHLCIWSLRENSHPDSAKHEKPRSDSSHGRTQTCMLTRRAAVKSSPPSVERDTEPAIACRTHLLWLLAKIGHKVGCRVWIAASDHGKVCNNERLGDLSLPSLPILTDSAFQKIIRKIDVLWLEGNDVVAAYEIEQAHTHVSMSLLRLHDLGALFPDHEMQLCIVAPHDRFEKVQFELSRPTFQERSMQKHCAFISEELLLEQEEHILRWASSPSVIHDFIGNLGERREAYSPQARPLSQAEKAFSVPKATRESL